MRVRTQAAIQKHIDSCISSTVNLPADISLQEVEQIYFLAWKLGCKGITVYREGSREGILVTDDGVKQQQAKEEKEHFRPRDEGQKTPQHPISTPLHPENEIKPVKRPQLLECRT